MDSAKYIGMDVHKETISIAVMNSSGKLVMESVLETKACTIVQFIQGAVPQLCDDQQGSHARHESAEGSVSKLGYSLRRYIRLCTATSFGMVEQDHGSRRPPTG
jgi:hypothetical protein